MKQRLKRIVSGLLGLMLVMSIAPGDVAFAEGEASTGKTSSTYYTPNMIAAARENATKYSWAASEVTAVVAKANNWLGHVDTIYNMVTNHTIPRSSYLGEEEDPLNGYCMYCGANLKSIYGNHGWNFDMINHPWEIQCKECEKYFPSNDFDSFYQNGLNDKGEFDRTLALENNGILCGRGERDENGNYVAYDEYEDNPYGYGDPDGNLYNEKFTELYAANAKDPYHDVAITQGWGDFATGGTSGVPSAGYFWGVDDGLGYNTGRTSGTVAEVHRYVAIANYGGIWYWHGRPDQPVVHAALTAFRDAYLYTGDKRYGIAGAKILDRVADLYPDFDYGIDCPNLVTSGNDNGRISGSTHENFVNRALTTSYDAFYDCYDEPELINYLSQKADAWDLENAKTTGALLRSNVEQNLLAETYNAVKNGDIRGNFGMMQETLITAAVILDNEDTEEIIEYVMSPMPNGGGLYDGILKRIDRDGYGDESAVVYNNIFSNSFINIIEILSRYPDVESQYDLANNPKVINSLSQGSDVILAGVRMPNIGDASSNFAGTGITDQSNLWLYGLKNTDDPVFAQMLYLINGNTANGIKYDIFTKNPETAKDKVEEVIAEHGELNLSKSNILTGYGFAALRDGVMADRSTSPPQPSTMHDWWMYWGPHNTSHGHADALNLGLDAFGLNFAPDLGYGSSGGIKEEWTTQWIEGTTSHNTVIVDDKQQTNYRQSHFPLHFDDAGDIKVMDVDVPDAYRGVVDTFRRTIVSVNIDENVSYALDFFRVVGGDEHVYSFHSQSEDTTLQFNDGVQLVAQSGGTYAGANIAYGQQYAKKDSGYSWMTNVERAANPGKNFSVDFEITDYQNLLNSSRNLHLKLTQLNGFELSEVARTDGETIPEPGNPTHIDYILARRSGEDLDTLFTTVLEPYENSSKINALTRVNVVRKDGTALGADAPVAAVKVELDGRTDYVVYSADNEVTYTVDGLFDFRGFVGVYTVDSNNQVARTYINDGTQIGDVVLERAALTGNVVDFTEGLQFENFIEVTADVEITDELLESLVGRMIVIENDGIDNAAYVIETAKEKDGNILIGTGDVDFARRNVLNDDLSIIPNFAVGNSYRIAMSKLEGSAPEAPVCEPVTFSFNANAVDTTDTTAWDTSKPNGSLSRVVGYGTGANAHNWYFYGLGANAQNAVDAGGAINKMVNIDTSKFRIRTTNGTVGTAGYFDTTAGGGTTMALSLKAPAAGYYVPAVYNSDGAALGNTEVRTIAFGPENTNNSIDDYISDAYTLPAGGAIYSDGETPIILAMNVASGNQIVASSVLSPLTGQPAVSTEEITINEIGGTETISVTVSNTPLVSSFAEFVSANENVATVSPEGVVTAVSVGTTVIEVTVGSFIAEVEVMVELDPVTFSFNVNAVDTTDATAWDTSKPNGSLSRVVGYGTGANAHNWYFYGLGANAQNAVDTGGAINKMVNIDTSKFRIRTVNGTVGTAGYFDTTAGGGTTIALSLKAPATGYYVPAVYNSDGATLGNTDVRTIAFGPENANNSIDDYMSGAYTLPVGGVIYSDGETPIILAMNVASGNQIVASSVLTPVSGSPVLSSDEITINEIGGTETISVMIGNTPLVNGFAEFVSADETVATVSPEGVVTAVSVGTTVIEVTVGSFIAEVEVTVAS